MTNARLAFRYTPANGMRDKTGRFAPLQIQNQAGTPQTLATLLAMSSGPDSSVSDWRSITIVTYPRGAGFDFLGNLIVHTATYPPLQKTQERGTLSRSGSPEKTKWAGHPSARILTVLSLLCP